MYPVLFKIGPITIYSLGLLWALGALAAVWILRLELKRYGYDPEIAASAVFGRIGCFLAGDATWGKVTDVPWAMAFPNAVAGWVDPLTGVPYPPGVGVHPTQLYEFLQSLFVFGVLWRLRKRNYPQGTIFSLYLILAGSMRFIVEFWRANPIVALGMTEYQWISLILVILGIGMLCYRRKPDPIKQNVHEFDTRNTRR
jgi:phosphatidylglycerol---prolipoprotein diacylglyceryl transferase